MSIKILGGVARGFPLDTPRSELTRPTSVMVKRKLFDWRQNLEGYIFVDLCSGSGAMGLEALSRGAEKVFLNDPLKSAFITMKNNRDNIIKSFKFEEAQITVTNQDAKVWVSKELGYQLPETEDVILFLDPPYENHALYHDVLRILKESKFQGEVWVEADKLRGPKIIEISGAFHSVIKTVEQGDHFVVVGKLV